MDVRSVLGEAKQTGIRRHNISRGDCCGRRLNRKQAYMAKITVEWEETDEVTPHNIRRRLYFDPWRTRLVEDGSWYDLAHLRDKELAVMWCRVNDVEFFDHTITNYPAKLRLLLLKVRAAGMNELRRIRPQWNHVPWGKSHIKLPVLPPREQPRIQRPKRERTMTSDDGGKTWRAC